MPLGAFRRCLRSIASQPRRSDVRDGAWRSVQVDASSAPIQAKAEDTGVQDDLEKRLQALRQ